MPMCKNEQSRSLCLELLLELAQGSYALFEELCTLIINQFRHLGIGLGAYGVRVSVVHVRVCARYVFLCGRLYACGCMGVGACVCGARACVCADVRSRAISSSASSSTGVCVSVRVFLWSLVCASLVRACLCVRRCACVCA